MSIPGVPQVGNTTPAGRALLAVVALVAITVGGLLGLYALTAPPDRAGLLRSMGMFVPYLAVAGPGVLASIFGGKMLSNQAQTQSDMAVVKSQTNGGPGENLDRAISAALDARGLVVPTAAPPTTPPATTTNGAGL